MTETITSLEGVPVISADPFSLENLIDPHDLHEQMREAGPVVYLDSYGIWGMARYEQVNAALKGWETFSSAAGAGLSNFRKEKPWRIPSLLLEADPPAHTRAREIVGSILAPPVLKALRGEFEREATLLVERLATLGSFDAVTELAEAYPLKVFGDAVGLPEEGREHLLPYANMVFNAFGPRNQLLEAAMADAQPVQQWIMDNCRRETLRPGGFGAQIWVAVDAGKIPEEWAPLLVRSLLSAGLDTTINGIAAAIYALASHPEQWSLLRQDPSLANLAFEETVRWESLVQTFFRTTTREVEIAGVRIPDGENVKDVQLFELSSHQPRLQFVHEHEQMELQCDFIAGCDGFHGVSRASLPEAIQTVFTRFYPFGWLGILMQAPPSSQELIYAYSERGFALVSTRSPELQRMYLQCDPNDDIAPWSDEMILEELQLRLATRGQWQLRIGPIIQKSILAMRSFVIEPMQYGRLFLAGDAAHIVPPTGAKGLNLAVADVRHLAHALTLFYKEERTDLLEAHSPPRRLPPSETMVHRWGNCLPKNLDCQPRTFPGTRSATALPRSL